MAYGSLTFGSFGLKTNEDFIISEDGTLTLNKLSSYPIGSIYQSIDPTSPAELFGGAWESIASNRVLIGSGDKYVVESTGGEETVVLTQENIPQYVISYSLMYDNGHKNVWESAITQTSTFAAEKSVIYSGGSNKPHNNIPPYYAVYMWKRIE